MADTMAASFLSGIPLGFVAFTQPLLWQWLVEVHSVADQRQPPRSHPAALSDWPEFVYCPDSKPQS